MNNIAAVLNSSKLHLFRSKSKNWHCKNWALNRHLSMFQQIFHKSRNQIQYHETDNTDLLLAVLALFDVMFSFLETLMLEYQINLPLWTWKLFDLVSQTSFQHIFKHPFDFRIWISNYKSFCKYWLSLHVLPSMHLS